MDKYLIFLKPEFEADIISVQDFESFFKKHNFSILKESNYIDSQNNQVIKGGVIIAKNQDISIKLLQSQNLVITFYDSSALEILGIFSKFLSIPTYICGENDEEY